MVIKTRDPGIRIRIETNADPFRIYHIYIFSATTTTTRCHQGRTAPTMGSPTTDPRQIRAKAPTPALAVSFLLFFICNSRKNFLEVKNGMKYVYLRVAFSFADVGLLSLDFQSQIRIRNTELTKNFSIVYPKNVTKLPEI
jgi:hypothetical protein